jgi:hypothetical protein
MPTEPKPLIVISYAHADKREHPAEGEVKWLSFVTGYLRPATKHGAVDLWLDRLMHGGADWEPEIEQKFRACDIFVLLVSRHSLSSDYLVDKEIPIIRERQAKGEAVHFYPLVLTPTRRQGFTSLATTTCARATGSRSPTTHCTNGTAKWRKPPTRSRRSRQRSASERSWHREMHRLRLHEPGQILWPCLRFETKNHSAPGLPARAHVSQR